MAYLPACFRNVSRADLPPQILEEQRAYAREYWRRTAARRASNPEKHLSDLAKSRNTKRAARRSLARWPAYAICRVKDRARMLGVPFDLVPADIVVPAVCPVLGIPIVLGGSRRSGNLPSIDRIIPALGYVRGNVRVISFRANMLKSNCTSSAELRMVAEYIDKECVSS